MMMDIQKLITGIEQQDRRAIAKSITLIESDAPRDKPLASALLSQLGQGIDDSRTPTKRIAFSGPPGAGKSTLIDQFGQYLIKKDHHVAVLTIDPSAPYEGDWSGGSILGDKTRMEALSKSKQAFIRPSPSKSGVLGGAAITTADVMTILECAHYDTIFLETIGIGQNEIDAKFLTDLMILVLPPASGDALQGIKRGIVEQADIIVINKADGDFITAAECTAHEYASVTKGAGILIVQCSALQGNGFDALNDAIDKQFNKLRPHLEEKRRQGVQHQFFRRLELEWPHILRQTPVLRDLAQEMLDQMIHKNQSPRESSEKFVKTLKSLLTRGP